MFAGVSQVELLGKTARELSLRRARLIGSSPEALVSAMKAIVALEARCSPREVALAVLGKPPTGFVVPWSEVSIGGYALQRVVSQAQLARIEARVGHLWPPGPNTLGAAAAAVTEAILSASRRSFSVLTWLDGEFGVKHVVGVLPAQLSAGGIAEIRVPADRAQGTGAAPDRAQRLGIGLRQCTATFGRLSFLALLTTGVVGAATPADPAAGDPRAHQVPGLR